MRLEINSTATSAYRYAGITSSQTGPVSLRIPSAQASAAYPALSDLALTLDQKYFWTEEWQQKERLADWDILIGDLYVAEDVEDMIRSLQDEDD